MLLQQHRSAVVAGHSARPNAAGFVTVNRESIVVCRGHGLKRRAQLVAVRATSGNAGREQIPGSQPQQQPVPQQQQQQQQQRPGPPPPGGAPRPPLALLPPAVAAQAMAAAAASGRLAADLTLQDVTVITSAWLPLLPRTLGECNKLLSQRMRNVLAGDPVAYDLIKQDGKDFMTGAMDAAEFADRFFGIFAAAPQQTASELFLQMVLILPTPDKRLQLLRHAQNPWVLPAGPLVNPAAAAAPPPAPAASAAVRQGHAASGQAAAAAGAAGDVDEGEEEDEEHEEDEEDEDEVDGDEGEIDDYEEFELEEEFEEAEEGDQDARQQRRQQQQAAAAAAGGSAGLGPADGAQGLRSEKDLVEFKGWQELDRTRLQQLASSVAVPSSEQLSAAAAARRPKSRKSALAGLRLDDGVHVNSVDSRPAKKAAGKKAKASAGGQSAAVDAQAGRPNAIVWLRQDLRVHDNPALTEAAKWAARQGGCVMFVYVHSPEEDGADVGSSGEDGEKCSWRPGGASLLWAAAALQSLSSDLKSRYGAGAAIVFKRGPYAAALQEVAAAVGASAVFCNRRYEPAMSAADAAVAESLAAAGLQLQSYSGLLLQEPWEVQLDLSKWYGHFGTLMPFYRAWSRAKPPPSPLPEPKSVPVLQKDPSKLAGGIPLQELGLYTPPRRRTPAAGQQQQQQSGMRIVISRPINSSSSKPISSSSSAAGTEVIDWGASIRSAWDISERGGLSLMTTFLSSSTGLAAYEAARSYADGRSVSRLSPYLHWGQLSVRLMWQRMKIAKAQAMSKTFHRRLVWRDLAYWQLHHWPNMAAQPIRTVYRNVEWSSGPEAAAHLAAWKQGRTGFPLVDAGMRELWATGWMQQSVRMVAAAFLTEYLHLPWTEGAAWFHDCLVDADLAINSMMWQNAGKSGLDQWNFTMLPTSKSQDPTGAYIKRWVPELLQLQPAYIHAPWEAPEAALAAADVVLGETYPHRIVSGGLSELRAVNVRAIRAARASAAAAGLADGRGYDMLVVPQGCTLKHDGTKTVLFTKQEYRQLDALITATGRPTGSTAAGMVDEGEEAEDAEAMLTDWQKKKKQKKGKVASSSSSSGLVGGTGKRGGSGSKQQQRSRATFRELQQRTLDDFMAKSS